MSNSFSTVLTLGFVSGNGNPDLDMVRQLTTFLNPSLLKSEDAGEAMTPLSDRAADYALWRVQSFEFVFIPLVQPTMVTGAFVTAALDLDGQSAKAETIDSVLAKPHMECQLGVQFRWKPRVRDLEGPRETWWELNTNNEAEVAVGPVFSVWLYGQTTNLLMIKPTGADAEPNFYTGKLFSVQLRVTYQFANWEPKPAMKVMEKEVFPTDAAKITTDADNNLVIEVTQTPEQANRKSLQQFMSRHESHLVSPRYHAPGVGKFASTSGLGTTVWSLADQAVPSVASSLGPWGWLLKGGYYFLRKLFSTTEDAETTSFLMYPSMSDAQRHNPAQMPQPITTPIDVPLSTVKVTQMNAPNVQIAGSNTTAQACPPPPPPGDTFPTSPTAPTKSPLFRQDGAGVWDFATANTKWFIPVMLSTGKAGSYTGTGSRQTGWSILAADYDTKRCYLNPYNQDTIPDDWDTDIYLTPNFPTAGATKEPPRQWDLIAFDLCVRGTPYLPCAPLAGTWQVNQPGILSQASSVLNALRSMQDAGTIPGPHGDQQWGGFWPLDPIFPIHNVGGQTDSPSMEQLGLLGATNVYGCTCLFNSTGFQTWQNNSTSTFSQAKISSPEGAYGVVLAATFANPTVDRMCAYIFVPKWNKDNFYVPGQRVNNITNVWNEYPTDSRWPGMINMDLGYFLITRQTKPVTSADRLKKLQQQLDALKLQIEDTKEQYLQGQVSSLSSSEDSDVEVCDNTSSSSWANCEY